MERGRPRAFDEEHALTEATKVFWRCGYRGASLAELTEAMEINKPSLYGTFGGKEQLFLKSLERYVEEHIARHVEAMQQEVNVRKAMEAFLGSVANGVTRRRGPSGCLVVNAMADCELASTPPFVSVAVKNALTAMKAVIEKRLQRGLDDGQLSRSANIGELATFFTTLMIGMSVMAKAGTSRSALNPVIANALGSIPLNGARPKFGRR